MRTLYLDLISGISGDMFIGAMLDLGVEYRVLEQELNKLGLTGYRLRAGRRHKASIEGVKFEVELTDPSAATSEHPATSSSGGHEHADSRDFQAISQLIRSSALSDWVKERSISVFRRIAVAEGKVHGLPPERVHFHEVGAIDSIIDIVGACLCLEWLGHPHVRAAAVVEGTGWVHCAHGRFPVPTTATLEILGARGIAVSQCDEPHELVTPTGAALLAEFAESFGPMQGLVAQRIGYGLGTRDHRTRPNVLRAILGEPAAPAGDHDWETDSIAVLETNLDDISGEVLGHFVETTLRAGALDVFHTAVQMKKNRPGVLLTVLCRPEDADRFTERLLRHTSAFGVRRSVLERRKLRREIIRVTTEFGDVSVKLGWLDGECVQTAPEFAVCQDKAVQAGVPVATVFEAAKRAAQATAQTSNRRVSG